MERRRVAAEVIHHSIKDKLLFCRKIYINFVLSEATFSTQGLINGNQSSPNRISVIYELPLLNVQIL